MIKSILFRLKETRREGKNPLKVFFSGIRIFLEYLYYKYLKKEKFKLDGKEYDYFYYPYNATWRNERCVEIPVIMNFLKNSRGNVLEFGNVLRHYVPVNHDVLDKYEKDYGVINKDIVELDSKEKYDLVISISTLEHVGWDEKPRNPKKINKAFEKLEKSLKKGGKLVFSVPYGWNSEIEKYLKENKKIKLYFLKRIKTDKWVQTDGFDDIKGYKYDNPYQSANALIIGVLEK